MLNGLPEEVNSAGPSYKVALLSIIFFELNIAFNNGAILS